MSHGCVIRINFREILKTKYYFQYIGINYYLQPNQWQHSIIWQKTQNHMINPDLLSININLD